MRANAPGHWRVGDRRSNLGYDAVTNLLQDLPHSGNPPTRAQFDSYNMTNKRTSATKIIVPAIAATMVTLLATTAWPASRTKLLHAFSGTDGEQPDGSLIIDRAGNLYGTASEGGANGYGNVFELSPGDNSTWTDKMVRDLSRTDGANPEASLIFDHAGNLYGTTNGNITDNLGTVFKLTPGGNGQWTQTVLHTFRGSDGEQPYAGLIFDAAGNLYGTTYVGGASFAGTVFELSPGDNNTWTYALIHSFDTND